MPATLTYPGVYIEEVPSGVRTITGVATSITAFIGRAARGPVNVATTINSYADYERIFGGLWLDSAMSYAVRDFYLNGGSRAVIVRLYQAVTAAQLAPVLVAANAVATAATGAVAGAANGAAVAAAARAVVNGTGAVASAERAAAEAVAAAAEAAAAGGANPADTAAAATGAVASAAADAAATAHPAYAKLDADTLHLVAASPGRWGNKLRVHVDHNVADANPALFNLIVRDDATEVIEVFRNLSVAAGPRRVDAVLAGQSQLIRVTGALPANPPAAHAEASPALGLWDDPATPQIPPTNSKVTAPIPNDGDTLNAARDFTPVGAQTRKQGLYALEQVDLFNLLCLPPHTLQGPPHTLQGDIEATLISSAIAYCAERRAMLLVDPPSGWTSKDNAKAGIGNEVGDVSKNAAIFFPRLLQANPLRDSQEEAFVPCGAMAGLFARTDTVRGVWKAPAGLDATLIGVPKLSVALTDAENGELNPLGINCLRSFAGVGRIAWGARTREGDDRRASEWKYIPVRRTALFIEESLFRGTQWVVFEPNDEPLWASIRLNVGAFMQGLFRQGAFQGSSPREAYFVKCDKETTTQNDINNGVVNIAVGFAPLKPAEFVVIRLQQIAGQILV